MTPATANGQRLVLGAAFCVCLAWLAFILYQVFVFANPPLVSRPQVLSADAVVEGKLQIKGGEIRLHVTRVLWARKPLEPKDFDESGVPVRRSIAGWERDGARVYAAVQKTGGGFRIQTVPTEDRQQRIQDPEPIYPALPIVERQLDELRPKGK
jgi:hypothetical protein